MENLAGFPPVLSANYMSQEALAPRRVSTPPSTWRKPYSAWSDARGQSFPPCTLGWKLRRIPQRCSSCRSEANLSLSRGKGAAWFLPVSVERLASFSCTSQCSGCDFPGESGDPHACLRSCPPPGASRVCCCDSPTRPSSNCGRFRLPLTLHLSVDHLDSPSCKCLAFRCFTASFWGHFQHLPRPAKGGDCARRRAKYGDLV